MELDRERYQGGIDVALSRIKYVLDTFEKVKVGVKGGMSYEERDKLWQHQPVQSCTIEEMLGALISAEQQLKIINDDDENIKYD